VYVFSIYVVSNKNILETGSIPTIDIKLKIFLTGTIAVIWLIGRLGFYVDSRALFLGWSTRRNVVLGQLHGSVDEILSTGL